MGANLASCLWPKCPQREPELIALKMAAQVEHGMVGGPVAKVIKRAE